MKTMPQNRVLKRIINICESRAIILPKSWAEELPNFVWLEKKNGELVIRPAEVA